MRVFGTTADGEIVHAIDLAAGDLTVTLLTWGAAVRSVRLAGVDHDLTLGSDDLADYETTMPYAGVLIGPVANRIGNARITLEGMTYELERNEGGRVHLHSGRRGTHRRVWQVAETGPSHAVLTCALGDGACGLPGNRMITARFDLEAPATLRLRVTGTTDAVTAMNFANHSYWNCDGAAPWTGHRLRIAADHYLPVDAATCPTGEIAPVAGTAMDFRAPREIAVGAPALDHNFCLSEGPVPLREVLTLTGKSGVALRLATDQPGLQVYNGANAQAPGTGPHAGIAIEAQGWPDAPNHPGFPQITVTPDAPYRQETTFTFSRP